MHYSAKWSFVSNKLPCNGALICILYSAIPHLYNLNTTLFQSAKSHVSQNRYFHSKAFAMVLPQRQSSELRAFVIVRAPSQRWRSGRRVNSLREMVRVLVEFDSLWGLECSTFATRGWFSQFSRAWVFQGCANRWRCIGKVEVSFVNLTWQVLETKFY